MHTIALDRFSGFSELYDSARPNPPQKTCQIICSLLNRPKLERVVDLGCGSGLSTKIWKDLCTDLIGLEPNAEMRAMAIANYPEIQFADGNSYATGLAADSVDLVFCSQSFHWMEPQATLAEIKRVLKADGVLAILDCDWPVSIGKVSEMAYKSLFAGVYRYHQQYATVLPKEQQWPKKQHLQNLVDSGYFTYCKEVCFDNVERCDAQRFINIALSQGHLQTLLKYGIKEIQPEIERFRELVVQDIPAEKDMYITYRMVLGLK
jgi:ubiquinone/menaquinone biosynthesis C-methylase UbiE